MLHEAAATVSAQLDWANRNKKKNKLKTESVLAKREKKFGSQKQRMKVKWLERCSMLKEKKSKCVWVKVSWVSSPLLETKMLNEKNSYTNHQSLLDSYEGRAKKKHTKWTTSVCTHGHRLIHSHTPHYQHYILTQPKSTIITIILVFMFYDSRHTCDALSTGHTHSFTHTHTHIYNVLYAYKFTRNKRFIPSRKERTKKNLLKTKKPAYEMKFK